MKWIINGKYEYDTVNTIRSITEERFLLQVLAQNRCIFYFKHLHPLYCTTEVTVVRLGDGFPDEAITLKKTSLIV